jgi:putative acetyltransferase
MLTIIRPEEPRDVPAIELVTIQAFKLAPHTDHTEQFIVRELRLANALTVSLLAEANEQIVGHVAVSPVQISNGADSWFGLGPISVLPAHQGQGIGTQLMEAAIQKLQARSAKGCVVLGDPNYYGRFGFAPVAGLVLLGAPAEYFQAMSLNSDIPQGEVTYHQAFEAMQ